MIVYPTRRATILAWATVAIASRATAEEARIRHILAVAAVGGRSWPNWVAFEDELR